MDALPNLYIPHIFRWSPVQFSTETLNYHRESAKTLNTRPWSATKTFSICDISRELGKCFEFIRRANVGFLINRFDLDTVSSSDRVIDNAARINSAIQHEKKLILSEFSSSHFSCNVIRGLFKK